MMADLFWTLATSYFVLGAIALLALAALVIGHVPFGQYVPVIGPYVVLARFAAYPLLMLLAFLIGFRLSDERAETQRLKRELAFSQLQLKVQIEAAADAERLRRAAEGEAAAANEKVTTYENELAKAAHGPACTLDDFDIRGLRNIAH